MIDVDPNDIGGADSSRAIDGEAGASVAARSSTPPLRASAVEVAIAAVLLNSQRARGDRGRARVSIGTGKIEIVARGIHGEADDAQPFWMTPPKVVLPPLITQGRAPVAEPLVMVWLDAVPAVVSNPPTDANAVPLRSSVPMLPTEPMVIAAGTAEGRRRCRP